MSLCSRLLHTRGRLAGWISSSFFHYKKLILQSNDHRASFLLGFNKEFVFWPLFDLVAGLFDNVNAVKSNFLTLRLATFKRWFLLVSLIIEQFDIEFTKSYFLYKLWIFRHILTIKLLDRVHSSLTWNSHSIRSSSFSYANMLLTIPYNVSPHTLLEKKMKIT